MTIIAMLHRSKDPEKVEKAYGCAAAAKMEGVTFYYFTPGMVDLEQKVIHGKEYTKGHWQQKTFPFPDVIYNLRGPNTKKQQHIFQELKKEIPFISSSVGSKLTVYRKINEGKDFKSFLIPFHTYENTNKFFEFLDKHKEIVLKPSSGNKGKNVFFIKKQNNRFTLNQSTVSKQELQSFVKKVTKQNQPWIVQKYIHCKTKQGLPYDIRLHVLKGVNGEWEKAIVYPRTSLGDGTVSNISAGGQVGFIQEFLKREFDTSYFDMRRTLEVFALQFAQHFESLYQDRYFDQLGIDIGIDAEKKIWIYEVNWRPGSTFFNLKVCKAVIQYCISIANRKHLQKKEVRSQ